jgi:hypothetical protein
MPSCPDVTPPSPPSPPLTVERAQVILEDAACQLLDIEQRLKDTHERLPAPPDIDARQEGELPYDRATDILGTIECVIEDNIRPAVEVLRRSAYITDAQLEAEHRELLARRVEL